MHTKQYIVLHENMQSLGNVMIHVQKKKQQQIKILIRPRDIVLLNADTDINAV